MRAAVGGPNAKNPVCMPEIGFCNVGDGIHRPGPAPPPTENNVLRKKVVFRQHQCPLKNLREGCTPNIPILV